MTARILANAATHCGPLEQKYATPARISPSSHASALHFSTVSWSDLIRQVVICHADAARGQAVDGNGMLVA
jgi:hypothetical protein